MNCPNCGKELMNVNGRFVCIECGTEVAEGDINDTQESPVETSPEVVETVQEPINTPVEPVSEELTNLDQPIANESIPELTQVEEAPPVDIPTTDMAPVDIPVMDTNTNDEPMEVMADATENVTSSQEPSLSLESPVSDLSPADAQFTSPVGTAIETETSDIKSQIEQNLGPVSEDILSTPNALPDTEQSDSSQVSEISPISVDNQALGVPEAELQSFDAQPDVNTQDVSQSIPFDTLSTTNTFSPSEQSAPSDLGQVATIEPQVTPEVTQVIDQQPAESTPVTPVFDTPIDPYDVADTTIPQGMPSFANAASEIQPSQTASFDTQVAQDTMSQPVTTNNKPLFIILIAGAVFLLLLIIIGIIAYLKLTAPIA